MQTLRPIQTRSAALASVRSYYFQMFVCNHRAKQRESCADRIEPSMAQMRVWFRRAGDIAIARQSGAIR